MLKWISNLAIEAANRFRTISGMQYDPEWVKNNPGWYNPPTAAGITVDEVTALNQSTVFAAVSVIAGTAASLPLPVYQRLESGGKRRSPEHPLYYAIHDEPNYDCSSLQFREALYAHVLTWGNGYAEIERDGAGRAIALWLLAPWQVEPTYNKRGDLKYEVTANGKKKTLWPEDIIHIAGLSFDGVKGYSVIKLARESLALNAATEKFGASFFGNAARPSGVFTHPNKLKPQAEEQFKKNIHDNYQGSANAGGALFLTEGVTYAPYTIPPEEAQFLGTRLFQISEVARWFKVHPYFLGDLSHSTFSNGEQAMIHFVIHTIRPFCIRAEQEFNRKLFLPSERREFYCEHNIDGLLRGDTMTRYGAYAIGRTNGWLSVNDVRNSEGLNPIEGGDVYLSPLNMVSAAPAAAPAPPPTDPKPEPVPEEKQSEIQKANVKALALEAVKGTVLDAYGRMARREATAIRRASKKPNLAEWAEEFYDDHKTLLVESLGPSVRAYLAVAESRASADVVTQRISEQITASHRAVLLEAIGANPAKLDEVVERLCTEHEVSHDDFMNMLSHLGE